VKVLIDIDVILDVLLERDPWASEAAQLLAAAEKGQIVGFIAGHTPSTVYYLTRKARGRQAADHAMMDLLRIARVVPVETADFHRALTLGFDDFEDAVQGACALKIAADYVATRNTSDFDSLPIPSQPPGGILAQL
jgi:predicted nucleic acid-binding protein